MKSLTNTKAKLIELLSPFEFVSGQNLGAALGVSRACVWKHINQLIDWGVDIQRAAQGYKLNEALILLNHQKISAHYEKLGKDLPKAHLFYELDSTNSFLKSTKHQDKKVLCLAEKQSKGRGRFGRYWHSPFGLNLYYSLKLTLDCDLSQLTGLSLVISLSLIEALGTMGFGDSLKVKWPNDIYWQDKKLAGSLIEVMAETNGLCVIIIGIGMNVNMIDLFGEIDKPWTSLRQIMQKIYDRNVLAALFTHYIETSLDTFEQHGLAAFHDKWQQSDYLANKRLTIKSHQQTLTGMANGIDDKGQLIIIDDNGKWHYCNSGDTTLSSMM
jgi:BirA family transcriptional regulator, biotin operon repressor / biotin---[acetyl-CoA-carboxylase] ligase